MRDKHMNTELLQKTISLLEELHSSNAQHYATNLCDDLLFRQKQNDILNLLTDLRIELIGIKTNDEIKGQKIVDLVRNSDIAENFDWYKTPVCLVLENGMQLFASSDEEGNSTGEIFGIRKDNKIFMLGQ